MPSARACLLMLTAVPAKRLAGSTLYCQAPLAAQRSSAGSSLAAEGHV